MAEQLEPHTAVAGPGKLAIAQEFLVDTRAEMDKVSWPTKDELIAQTRMVLIAALTLGVVIGLLDLVLQWILIDGVGKLAK